MLQNAMGAFYKKSFHVYPLLEPLFQGLFLNLKVSAKKGNQINFPKTYQSYIDPNI